MRSSPDPAEFSPDAAPPDSRLDVEAEDYVASLFRALGYRVQRDVLVSGNQIDVIAERVLPGYGRVRILVEVKHRTKQSISKAEVLAWAHVVGPLVDGGEFAKAIMVSDTTFTRTAREAIREFPRLNLLTSAELEREFLSVDESLARYVSDYRAAPISRRFVDLDLKPQASFHKSHDASHPNPTSISRLAQESLAHPSDLIVLFADYGAGKTTALERTKVDLAGRYLRAHRGRIPVFYYLKDFGKFGNLDAFISATVAREFGITIPAEVFWELDRQSRFVHLLDGFDEISLRADSARRSTLLALFSPLLFGPCPAILSTRPSYFVSITEYRTILDRLRDAGGYEYGVASQVPSIGHRVRDYAQRLRSQFQPSDVARMTTGNYSSYVLRALDSGQIDEYLGKFEEEFRAHGLESAAQVRSFIDSIYDLSDLMTRPIILEMIVTMILERILD
ncbi:MAG: restriction endonuclease, partial [Actinobacteria bacterium]|nr:restriction endonuclease [Actinomycetota bacterium]